MNLVDRHIFAFLHSFYDGSLCSRAKRTHLPELRGVQTERNMGSCQCMLMEFVTVDK